MSKNSKGYPSAWMTNQIQYAMYERAGWRCEHCGMEFKPGSTKAITARNQDGRPVILTVYHLDGNPANCAYENLLVCCQRCHLHIQGVWKPGGCLPATWIPAPEWITKRGLAYSIVAIQLKLF